MAVTAATLGRQRQMQHSSGGDGITRSGQGEAVGTAAPRRRAAVAMAETAVGLLPQSSLSSHLRGSSLLFFIK